MRSSWSKDYKWYEYCSHCRSSVFVGNLPDKFGECECGEMMIYCSKDTLLEYVKGKGV